jgi:hypothetical protein
VYVYSGASGALIRRHDGAQAGVRLGTRVVIPGDVNHDGRADVAAAHALFFAPEHSAVHVFSGLDGSLLHVFTGAVAGYGLSSAGDLDGDGAVDIAVGEPAFHGTWVLQGRVRVYSGSTGAVLLEKRGSKMHQHFGWSVGSAGDANGDSVPDLLVGTLYGDVSFVSSGYVTVLSGVDGAVLSQVEAGPSQDYFAHSVAGVGDVNGDGLDDFAASAPEFTEGTPGYGFARVFLSGCPEPVRYCFAAANSTGGGAQLSHLGGPSISANNMALVVDHAPPGKLALFRYGSASAQAPLGDGFLCIGGTTFRLGSPQMIESNGQIFRAIDFSNPPAGSGPAQILPGSTWHFQMQYRDPAGPLGSGFNSTDALKATFVL